ncbi:MAG: PKD domain-containing protein [archaeon]
MKKLIIPIIFVFVLVFMASAVTAEAYVDINPENPTEADNLNCFIGNAESYNPNSFLYVWFENDVRQESLTGFGAETVTSAHTDVGDFWKCEVYVPNPFPPYIPIPVANDYSEEVQITCLDADNDGVCDVDEEPFTGITVTATPDYGEAPLEVQFNCNAQGGNRPLTYDWNFGDDIVTNVQNPTYTYEEVGNYTATCTAFDSDNDFITGNVSVEVVEPYVPPVINITSIDCFDTVIVDGNQACTVFVEADGEALGGANVDIYYIDGSYFGSCTTDSISGGCIAQDIQESTGNFTVYATAELSGYIEDVDTYPRFNYEVWDHEYDIANLAIYNDIEFQNPDDVFYRGESLYVKFQIIDLATGEYVCENIVTATELISNQAGGRVELSEIDFDDRCCEYYYELDMIPLTHDFIGESFVFAFAFDIPNHSGGQAQAPLTILNNPPEITPEISDIVFYENEILMRELSGNKFDLEDSGADLSWMVALTTSNCFTADILDDSLVIIPSMACESEMLIELYDLDNDKDSQTVHVTVLEVIPENTAPDVEILQPEDGSEFFEGDSINFVGYGFDLEDGLLTGDSLTWKSNIDGFLGYDVETNAVLSPGNHVIKLVGFDSEGLYDADSINVFVEEDVDFYDVDFTADPISGIAPLEVEFNCQAYGGNSPVEYRLFIPTFGPFFGQSLTYTFMDPGNYTALCEAVDADGDYINASLTVRVGEDIPVNEPPVVSNIPDQTIYEGESFSQFDLDDYVFDPDNDDDELTWSYASLSSTVLSIEIDEVSHVATVSYPVGWTGFGMIYFIAEDPEGEHDSDSATFTVLEEEDNDFTGIDFTADPMSGKAPLTVTFNCQAYGGDSPVEYRLFIPTFGPFFGQSLTYTFMDPGNYTALCEAVDADGDYISASLTVRVGEDIPVYEPPVVSNIPDQTIYEGEVFATFFLNDYVTDQDTPIEDIEWTFSGNNNIGVHLFNNSKVTLSFYFGWTGSETVSFTATDPEGMSDSDSATFTVLSLSNQAPTVNILSPGNGAGFYDDDSITFVGEGNDPEDGVLTGTNLTWSSSIDGFIGYGESFTTTLSEGTHIITLIGVDSDGASDSESITLYITKDTPDFIPQCSDGLDNDNDGYVDMDDPGCESPSDDSEYNLPDGIESGLYIGRIRISGYDWQYARPGQYVRLTLDLHNSADDDLEDLKVNFMIPDLGISANSDRFDLDEDDEITKTVLAYIPADATPGLYYAKIQVGNDDIRRTKHRYLIIED